MYNLARFIFIDIIFYVFVWDGHPHYSACRYYRLEYTCRVILFGNSKSNQEEADDAEAEAPRRRGFYCSHRMVQWCGQHTTSPIVDKLHIKSQLQGDTKQHMLCRVVSFWCCRRTRNYSRIRMTALR